MAMAEVHEAATRNSEETRRADAVQKGEKPGPNCPGQLSIYLIYRGRKKGGETSVDKRDDGDS